MTNGHQGSHPVTSPQFAELHEIPPGQITIGQLSERTGIPMQTLRRMMKRRELRSVGATRIGWYLFDERDVERLKALPPKQAGSLRFPPKQPFAPFGKGLVTPLAPPPAAPAPAPLPMIPDDSSRVRLAYATEIALAAMKLLREGKQILDVAFALEINPLLAARIAEDFARIDGALLFPKTLIDRLNKSTLDGTFPLRTPEHVVELVESAAAAHACVKCGQKAKRFCKDCALGARAEAKRAEGGGG